VVIAGRVYVGLRAFLATFVVRCTSTYCHPSDAGLSHRTPTRSALKRGFCPNDKLNKTHAKQAKQTEDTAHPLTSKIKKKKKLKWIDTRTGQSGAYY
jgi:hypothetical protein